MAGAGLLAVAGAAVLPATRESPLSIWILTDTLAPQRVLPLIGLGVALGLVGSRIFALALVLLAFGITGGFVAEDLLLSLLIAIPRAAAHLFLTSPISYLAVGTALVADGFIRAWLAPASAAIFGAALALIIKLTDPSLHNLVYTWTPVLVASWIVVAVALTARAFRKPWLFIFGRILGSWLLAIGLLYAGVALVPKREPLPLTPDSSQLPALDHTDPGKSSLDRLQQYSTPDANNPFRRP
jgi:hypothetical protein